MVPLDLDCLKEILARLPAKTLGRLKCVRKLFYSVITDPNFAHQHLTYSHIHGGDQVLVMAKDDWVNRGFVVIDPRKEEKERASVIKPSFLLPNTIMSNIVNGLVCFYELESKNPRLFNFTTGEHIRINRPTIDLDKYVLPRAYFLGYDSLNQEYKILHVLSNVRSGRLECDVLTLNSPRQTWRSIDVSYIPNGVITNSPSYCHEGAVYCKIRSRLHQRCTLLVIDVASETFDALHCPQDSEAFEFTSITQHQGQLSLVRLKDRTPNYSVSFWSLGPFAPSIWTLSKKSGLTSWTFRKTEELKLDSNILSSLVHGDFIQVLIEPDSKQEGMVCLDIRDLDTNCSMKMRVNNVFSEYKTYPFQYEPKIRSV